MSREDLGMLSAVAFGPGLILGFAYLLWWLFT